MVFVSDGEMFWTSEALAIPCSSGGSSWLSQFWANCEWGRRIQTIVESVRLIISFLHRSTLGVSSQQAIHVLDDDALFPVDTLGQLQQPPTTRVEAETDAGRVSLLHRKTGNRMVSCSKKTCVFVYAWTLVIVHVCRYATFTAVVSIDLVFCRCQNHSPVYTWLIVIPPDAMDLSTILWELSVNCYFIGVLMYNSESCGDTCMLYIMCMYTSSQINWELWLISATSCDWSSKSTKRLVSQFYSLQRHSQCTHLPCKCTTMWSVQYICTAHFVLHSIY